VGVEAPRQVCRDDFQVGHAVAVEQFTAEVTTGVLVNEFGPDGTVLFDADKRDDAAREQPFDQGSGCEFFQKGHRRPTSFPAYDDVVGARYQIVESLSRGGWLGGQVTVAKLV